MGSQAHEKQRLALLDKRAELLSALRLDRGKTVERVPDEDQSAIAHEEFVSMRLNCMDYSQVRLIDEALDRIESGDYGICQSCEENIPLKRLAALPWARYCVPCQEHINYEALIAREPVRVAS